MTAAVVMVQPTSLDLALTALEIVDVIHETDRFEIEFAYTMTNVGDIAYDPSGLRPGDSDNASIQTYLGAAPGLASFAAGGYSVDDAPVLQPGDSYSRRFFSNTAHLSDPMAFGDYVWLIADLRKTGEEPERRTDNIASVRVPSPAPAALAVVGLVGTMARRRR